MIGWGLRPWKCLSQCELVAEIKTWERLKADFEKWISPMGILQVAECELMIQGFRDEISEREREAMESRGEKYEI